MSINTVDVHSNQNKVYKLVKSLHSKKYRTLYNLFIIEGARYVKYAFDNHFKVEYICMSQTYYKSLTEYEALQMSQMSKIYIFSDVLFSEITETEQTQGVIGVLKIPEPLDVANLLKDNFGTQFIYLDRLQDPGNMGTIIRTADACGFEYILIGKGSVDPYNSKVIRSTAGSILNVKLIFVENTTDVLNALIESGYTLLVTALNAEYGYDDQSAYGVKNGLVIGNEANGVSEEIKSLSCNTIKIPIVGKAESLNASIAAGIMMYKVFEYCIQKRV